MTTITKELSSETKKLTLLYRHNFLFTLKKKSASINGEKVYFPQLSTLLSNFIQSDTSLIFSKVTESSLGNFVAEAIFCSQEDRKKLLLKYNIRKTLENKTNIKLHGGSFSEATLFLDHNKYWRVKKVVEPIHAKDIDAGIRLVEESSFISSLPAESKKLFPKIFDREVSTPATGLSYTMDYIPYPTFAESIFQGYMTTEFAIKSLINIYKGLNESLYNHVSLAEDDHYLFRIQRRLDRISLTPDEDGIQLKSIIKKASIKIDGKQCEGLPNIFEKIKNDDFCFELLKLPNPSLCHGDLILEDILISPITGKFILIDPNGQSTSKYYDFAKTFLSLSTYYEHFYYNLFKLEYKNDDDMNINFINNKEILFYERLSKLFWNYLEENHEIFFKKDKLWKERILLLTGLQNIAIVMFHFIRHEDEHRAIGFLLMGIKKLNEFYYEEKEK